MSHDETKCVNCRTPVPMTSSAAQAAFEDPVLAAAASAPMGPPESPEERATVVEAQRSDNAIRPFTTENLTEMARPDGNEMPSYPRPSDATPLTHDLSRAAPGDPWRCVRCGRTGATIAEASAVACSNPSTTNENVVHAIEGTGPFAERVSAEAIPVGDVMKAALSILDDWQNKHTVSMTPAARCELVNAIAAKLWGLRPTTVDDLRRERATPAWKGEGDQPLPEDGDIKAALPTRTERHDLYGEAMRLVGARHSKGGLVALVNWLLFRLDAKQSANERLAREVEKLKAAEEETFIEGYDAGYGQGADLDATCDVQGALEKWRELPSSGAEPAHDAKEKA